MFSILIVRILITYEYTKESNEKDDYSSSCYTIANL